MVAAVWVAILLQDSEGYSRYIGIIQQDRERRETGESSRGNVGDCAAVEVDVRKGGQAREDTRGDDFKRV